MLVLLAQQNTKEEHKNNKGCSTLWHCHLKAKEELEKLKYFNMQKYNLQKITLKETKIFQDIITL
jgi:hypothetical protein